MSTVIFDDGYLYSDTQSTHYKKGFFLGNKKSVLLEKKFNAEKIFKIGCMKFGVVGTTNGFVHFLNIKTAKTFPEKVYCYINGFYDRMFYSHSWIIQYNDTTDMLDIYNHRWWGWKKTTMKNRTEDKPNGRVFVMGSGADELKKSGYFDLFLNNLLKAEDLIQIAIVKDEFTGGNIKII